MICPCGVALDWLNRTYSTFMRVSRDPNAPPVRVTWEYTDEGAKLFTGKTPFRSHVCMTGVWSVPYQGRGEVDDSLLKKTDPIFDHEPGVALGSPEEWFRDGVPIGYNPKDCCGKPLHKRVLEISTPGILAWYADLDSPFIALIQERNTPGVILQGRTSEVEEVSTPGVVDLDNAAYLAEVETPDTVQWLQEPSVYEVETPDAVDAVTRAVVEEVETPNAVGLAAGLEVGVVLRSWTGRNDSPTATLDVGEVLGSWLGTNDSPTANVDVGEVLGSWLGTNDSPTATLDVGEVLEEGV